MKPKAAMIFAAGFGTRMRPLTNDQPKPMVPVAGQPMIDFAIDHARNAGAQKIVSNTHYLPEKITPHLAAKGLHTVHEGSEILDTGGGLKNALALLGSDPIWTLNPDTIWHGPNPLQFAADNWRPHEMDALLVCIPPDQALGTSSDGDFEIDQDGRVNRGRGVIYGGAQIIKTEGLYDISEKSFSLNVLWDKLIENNRCYACVYPGKWCDIGHPQGLLLAESLLGESNDA